MISALPGRSAGSSARVVSEAIKRRRFMLVGKGEGLLTPVYVDDLVAALKQSVGGKGYGPGIQSWYNQFLVVDPGNANHVYAGLEEVYETTNGGSSWSTVGPYWNFYFACWAPDSVYYDNLGIAAQLGLIPQRATV